MDVLDRLDAERARVDVLEHPFYVRWSRGELTGEELADYGAQYRHLVVALADLSAQAAETAHGGERAGLAAHAREEASHVGVWDQFADAMGSTRAAPSPDTVAAAASWTAPQTLPEQLAAMYVIEASQPAISETKLPGLGEHYGHQEDSAACAYFSLHARLDVEHAEQARELIRRAVDAGDRETHDRMVAAGRAALEGNWRMLDGVDREAAAVAA